MSFFRNNDLGAAVRPSAATQLEPCRRVLGNNGIPIDRKKYTSCSKHDDIDDDVERMVGEMVDRIVAEEEEMMLM